MQISNQTSFGSSKKIINAAIKEARDTSPLVSDNHVLSYQIRHDKKSGDFLCISTISEKPDEMSMFQKLKVSLGFAQKPQTPCVSATATISGGEAELYPEKLTEKLLGQVPVIKSLFSGEPVKIGDLPNTQS